MPVLGELPRAEADIRTAIGRLENPAQRLGDRLFWFHRLPQQRDTNDPAPPSELDQVALNHDEALHGLLAAVARNLDDAGVAFWVQVLRTWHQVISNDDYWALTLGIEERGAFEPPVVFSEIDALRADAVAFAAEPILVAARDAIAQDDTPTVRRILNAINELLDTGSWAAKAQLDIISPATERVRALCHAIREELGSKIAREDAAAKSNKVICDAEIKRFRDEIAPALGRVRQLAPPGHEAFNRSREEAALCLNGISTDFTWANDFIASEELREEALKLAEGTLGTMRIKDGLAQVRDAARKQRIFGPLKPILSAPSLSTINGFGFTVYGKSDFDAETNSYVTTHYFVALFIPVFPIARYRVICTGPRAYRFLGKLPLRRKDRWHLGVALLAVAAAILLGSLNANQNSGAYRGPSTSLPSSGTSAPSTSSRREQLSAIKARIDAGRARLDALDTQLQPIIDELNQLQARIEAIAVELKDLDAQQQAGRRINVNSYNSKVDTHNGLLSRYRALRAAHGSDIQLRDDLTRQDAALVEQYNGLLK